MRIWPTPEAPSALPLKGATPAARQSQFRGVRLLAWWHCDQWSV